MSAQISVELANGKKILFGSSDERGLHQVGTGGGGRQVSAAKFMSALESLGDLVAVLQTAVDRMPRKPDTVELAFGASLSTEGDLWIVSGKAEAEFKVTCTWEAAPAA